MPRPVWIETLLNRKALLASFTDDMSQRIDKSHTESREAVREGDLNRATLTLAKADAFNDLLTLVKRYEQEDKDVNFRQNQEKGG